MSLEDGRHLSLLPTSVTIALVVCAVYLLSSSIYNLWFNPLSRFPGPTINAVSTLPGLFGRLSGRDPFYLHSLHQQYGEIVRVAPNELSFINPKAWKEIHGFNKAALPKHETRMLNSPFAKSSIIAAHDTLHARLRRTFSHAFSDRALKEQEPLIRCHIEKLVRRLKEKHGENAEAEIDMVQWYNFTTFDIMADLTFGESMGMLDNSEYVPWVRNMFKAIKFVIMGVFLGEYRLLKMLLNILTMPLKSAREAHLQYVKDRVDLRMSKKSDRPDIWSFVLRHEEDAMALSPLEKHANASILMSAGTETTASLLSGLTYYLLRNPDAMRKVLEEVRLLKPDEMDMGALAKLPFLNACLEEAFRMYPPVPIGLYRCVPANGVHICGEFIPGGTMVSITQYAAYRSASNFYLPDQFIPERWLGDDAQFASDNKSVLQPFSAGPRNCIGKNLAYHELRLVVFNILWNFDLTLCTQSADWSNQLIYGVWEKIPLMVTLKLAANTEREKAPAQ